MDIIQLNDRKYFSSKDWHNLVKPTDELRLTNRSIRQMETYDSLVEQAHIIELRRGEANPFSGSLLVNPLMLIDPVAQKAIEHHFSETAPQAIASSKESAALGLAGIRLDLIAEDKEVMLLLQMISKQKYLEKRQKQLEESIPKLIEESAQKMSGQAGYYTILAYANLIQKRIDVEAAKSLGRSAAALSKELGYEIGSAPDVRFGRINAYPAEVLQVVFEEIK